MQVGDLIKIIEGKHEGQTGQVIGLYQAQGLERLRDEDFSGLWWVVFEDGSQDVIQEKNAELLH